MALTFPLSLADFFDQVRFTALEFQLSDALEISETGAGEILTARNGQRLWGGTVSIVQNRYRDQEVIQSKLDVLRNSGASFLIGDRFAQYPKADPDGSILGATAVTVHSIEANNRELKLQGAPDGYTVSAGDHISITYGSSPVKYAYFRVVTGSSFSDATSPTRTGLIEVQPFISSSISAGASVQLVKPCLKAVYVPGSITGGSRSSLNIEGPIQFSWRQSLR